jgi:hypothetical protein
LETVRSGRGFVVDLSGGRSLKYYYWIHVRIPREPVEYQRFLKGSLYWDGMEPFIKRYVHKSTNEPWNRSKHAVSCGAPAAADHDHYARIRTRIITILYMSTHNDRTPIRPSCSMSSVDGVQSCRLGSLSSGGGGPRLRAGRRRASRARTG